MGATGRSKWTRRAATTLAAVSIGIGVWAQGAGTAVAPEPAKLHVALGAQSGSTAPATYVQSNVQTSVRYYSGSWTTDSYGPPAGTPCSNYALRADETAWKVIQVHGSLRRCV